MRAARLAVFAAIAAGLLLLFVLVAGGRLLVDALWFDHLGYFSVFRTVLQTKILFFVAGALVAFLLIFTLGIAAVQEQRGRVRVVLRRDGNGATTIPELIAPIVERIPWKTLVAVAALVLAVLFGIGQAAGWERYLLWWHAAPFGARDPLFGRDISFYLFTLPAYRMLSGSGLGLIFLAALVAAAVFWLQGALDFRRSGAVIPEAAVRLVSIVLALVFLVKAFDYWLGRYELLLRSDGAVFGAGYTATNVRLPIQWVLVVLSLVAAALCAANVRRRGWQLPILAVVLVLGASILSTVVPDLYHRLRVRPDELRVERPYLEHNIALTRLAYGLDQVRVTPFPAATRLDASAIERNRETFSNVRLWDPGPLLDAYRQLQVIRLYYDFHDVDIDRYDLPGGRRQVMLGAREIVPEQLPPNARTWVNQRLQFTHGFGVVMSPVTESEGEGLPKLFVKDIPPRSTQDVEITEPRIYFGEETTDYVVTNAAAEEFDYPKGDENVYSTYGGNGGIVFGSLPRRLLFAWTFADVNLLISANIRRDSRILFRRALQDRIHRLAPFLRLDHDPYMVIADGRLYWMQDTYTTSESFPYSEALRGVGLNYIRNSVKVVVDAYHGTVDLYAMSADEPVLASYSRIFPGLFRPWTEMPDALQKHIRYPEDLFVIQAEMYRTYHMTRPDVFYNKEDLWNFPTETVGSSSATVEPYYVIMKLPGEAEEEFILMQPMTPSNRNNMVAWLAARCDQPNYGGLVEYQFPKERLVYGPQQIEARIDQDTLISQQLSLWNQMGSRVIRGNLLVIPVEDSVVYVEPLFLKSEQGQIPELKRVIAAYEGLVAMEPTLDQALRAVLTGVRPAAAAAAAPAAALPAAGIREARDRYEAALESLRQGDWTRFGREMDALGKALAERAAAPPPP